jgi:hypothetical protein
MNGMRAGFMMASGTVVAAGVALTAAKATDFEITRSTVDGGGVMFSTGGTFELSGTIGQPDTGLLSGGAFELSAGFWFPLSPDDCNSDGWVNLIDYGDFERCLSGPGGGLPQPECNCFDIDGDNDVDLSDIAEFQYGFSGG